MDYSFLDQLKEASNESAKILRGYVIKRHKEEPENEKIYPYEAHFTALMYHLLITKGISMEDLRIESRYKNWDDRYDLNYWDDKDEVDYFVEVKLMFRLGEENKLRLSGRGGYSAIEKDLEKLGKLPNRKDIVPVMIVAYVGYQPYSEADKKTWEKQIPHEKRIILNFS